MHGIFFKSQNKKVLFKYPINPEDKKEKKRSINFIKYKMFMPRKKTFHKKPKIWGKQFNS